MSAPKYAKRRDYSELPQVRALEDLGFEVHREMPVDLLVLKWVTYEQLLRAIERREDGLFRLITVLECKTPVTKQGTAKKRKDQQEQDAFCERWAVKKALAPMDALLMCGETVTLT